MKSLVGLLFFLTILNGFILYPTNNNLRIRQNPMKMNLFNRTLISQTPIINKNIKYIPFMCIVFTYLFFNYMNLYL